MTRRVVVTGMGVITPLGNDVPTFWEHLVAGRTGVTRIEGFDASAMDSRIAGEIKHFQPEPEIEKKEGRRMDRFVQYGLKAAFEALRDSKLDLSSAARDRIGVIIGSGIGGIQSLEKQHELLLHRGPDRVSPFFIPLMIANMASGHLAIKLGLTGPNSCPVTACASGSNAVADATRLIREGHADAVFAGGAEAAVTPLSVAGFCAAKALSVRNDAPERASRPFDKDRDGFIIAEGAGVVVLEDLEHARARGAEILAEIVGLGMTDDAYHITAPHPDGDGGARAMALAVADAGQKPEAVQYINAHGTSTVHGDVAEIKAIKRVFGGHAGRLAVSSTKSMTGHCLGAAGGMELIAVVKTLQTQTIHPTVNLEHPDPECDLDFVPGAARRAEVEYALSNSFGFGGHNFSILTRRFPA